MEAYSVMNFQDAPQPPTSQSAPPSRRSFGVRYLLILVLALVAGAIVLERRTRPELLVGPMVQIPAPDCVTIVWEMNAPLGGGAAWIEETPDTPRIAKAVQSGRRYEATFRGLPAGKSLTYTIVCDRGLFGSAKLAGPYETKIPPPRGTPFRFLAFGDSGNGSNTQADFAARMATAGADLIIHVGDLVYPAGDGETYPTHFYEPNAAIIRQAPFMPSLGNHDVATDQGRPLLRHFVCPENGPPGIEPERCYWFDYGDARFVALDSNIVQASGALTTEQLKSIVAPWVRKVLADCDARWKFVFFHHPYYTGSTHPAEGGAFMKEAFLEVFEACGVDMVFCGHNHLYERTAPMRNDAIVEDGKGIVYIVTGAGGVSRYPEQMPNPPYIRYYNDSVFSFTQVDISAERLELRQIDETGKTIDSYTLTKPAGGAMQPPPMRPITTLR